MKGMWHAARIGVARGLTEFGLSLRSMQDQTSTVVLVAATLGYLYLQRDVPVEGTGLTLPAVMLPGILAGLMVMGLVSGPAMQLAMEREDGTLLRARCAPRGMIGYVTGQVVLHTLNMLLMLVAILAPSAVVFGALDARGLAGLSTFMWVTILGLLATLPLGIIIGAIVPSAQKAALWATLPIMGLAAISGIFYPITELWGWLQVVAQTFPMYWIGHGLRAALLPPEAAVIELGGTWRLLEAAGVLVAWSLAGAAVAPRVLRRMARRQSGTAVAKAREDVAQWVR